ncbi:hypothetical protein SLEP1_g11864 [Rubroshorea leprosula]|nr:hypothetical protein SLEP1_g11864 [Rubroshorea leprosula]
MLPLYCTNIWTQQGFEGHNLTNEAFRQLQDPVHTIIIILIRFMFAQVCFFRYRD